MLKSASLKRLVPFRLSRERANLTAVESDCLRLVFECRDKGWPAGVHWTALLSNPAYRSTATIDQAKLRVLLAPILAGVFRFVKLNKSLSTVSG